MSATAPVEVADSDLLSERETADWLGPLIGDDPNAYALAEKVLGHRIDAPRLTRGECAAVERALHKDALIQWAADIERCLRAEGPASLLPVVTEIKRKIEAEDYLVALDILELWKTLEFIPTLNSGSYLHMEQLRHDRKQRGALTTKTNTQKKRAPLREDIIRLIKSGMKQAGIVQEIMRTHGLGRSRSWAYLKDVRDGHG